MLKSMNTTDYINLEHIYSANNYHPLDVVIAHGKGVWVYDVDGKKYLDFLSGYSALNHGHQHPKIIRAAKKQLAYLTLTSRAFRNDQIGLFCKELCALAGFEKALLMNTGAEAVETALKIARKWGYLVKGIQKNKAEIIVCANNFHGRTISIISFSSEKQYRDGFGPYTLGFRLVEYDNTLALEKAITKNTAAVLLEPIQGEGGIIIPKNGYLTEVKRICKKNNVLFMLDEIQTGLGRSGKLFAYEYEKNAKPDVLIIGKALGGGICPVSAVLTKNSIMDVIKPGDHGSTFGGNPFACAVSRVALQVLQDEKMVENSFSMGNYFLTKLRGIKSKFIKEIRGKGLMIGIELTKESGGARIFCETLARMGVLCKETHSSVLRLMPPLIVGKEELDFGFAKIKKVLEREV